MRVPSSSFSIGSPVRLACLCGCAVLLSGCFTKKSRLTHLTAVHLAPPIVPAPPELLDTPPDINGEVPPWVQLVATHNVPARPHVAPQPAPEPAHAEKTPQPTFVPELPTQEMLAAKNDTEHSLELAEKNLALTSGKPLNPMQQDLASKVRGFSDSAREAMKAGDWGRAKTFSKKAEVLSGQLVSSL